MGLQQVGLALLLMAGAWGQASAPAGEVTQSAGVDFLGYTKVQREWRSVDGWRAR